MPNLRQTVLLCILWAAVAWLTTAAWGMIAQDAGFGDSLTKYYAIRAPLVGAVAGAAWAPILCGLPGGRRWRLRLVQGAVAGQLVGSSATCLLLFLWPNEMQNDRMDAFKWAKTFWALYWYVFIPAGVVAGVLSIWIAAALGDRPARLEP